MNGKSILIKARWERFAAFWILLLATALVPSAAWGAHPLRIPGADRTRVGIYIEDLRSGKVLADYNSADLYTPASVMKSLTAASVISELMPSGTFVTPVKAIGEVRDGVLSGNIVIQVVGDPTIESRHFSRYQGFADSVAASVRGAGIRVVEGSVVIDDALFRDGTVPEGWDPADLKYSYGAVMRGANYRNNASGKQAVRDPAAAMRSDVTGALTRAGVEVRGGKVAGIDKRKVLNLHAHTSPRVVDILHSLMVRSDNLFAEGMLRALEPFNTRADAIDYEVALWKQRGLNFDGIAIYDGSGLSRYNRVSPRFMADVYRSMYNDPLRRQYSDLFPRAGQEGTMRNFLKDTRLQGLLAMKTGSMSGVQCFGGYLLDKEGEPTHIVVVFVNGFTCGRDTLKRQIADFLLETLP